MSPQWEITDPQRLDAFLASENENLSRGQFQKEIEAGSVRVNGKVIKKSSTKLVVGDVVEFAQSDDVVESSHIDPVDLGMVVLYEDDDCMVIDKPSGFAVHPGVGMLPDEKTILHGIAHLFTERSLPFSADSVLVHRLDKETTGCLLVAKNDKAHRTLQKQFENRTVTKMYLAIVAGVPEHETAVIDAPIGRNLTDRTKMSVLRTSTSRDARTTYRVLDATDDVALLECDLHTGRTHQVRVHLSSIGHPLLGDPTYTSSKSEELSSKFEVLSLCLHAWKLSFTSPVSGENVLVESPVPVSLLGIAQRIPFDLKSLGFRSGQ